MILERYDYLPSNYLCSKLLGLLYEQKKKNLFITMYDMLVDHDFIPTYKVAMNIIPSLIENGDVDSFFNCFMRIPSIRNNISIDDYKRIFMSAALLGRYEEMDIMYLNIDRSKIYENFFIDILEILSSKSKDIYLKWTKNYYVKFPKPSTINHLKVSLYENRLLYIIEHINEKEIKNNFPEIIHFKHIIDELDDSLRFWILSTLQRFQSIRDIQEYYTFNIKVLPKLLLNFISNVVLEFCRINDLENAFKWRETIKNKHLQCDLTLLSLCYDKKYINGVKMYHNNILKNIKDQYIIEKIINCYADLDMIDEAKKIYYQYSLTIDDHILFNSFIYICNKTGDYESVKKEIERRKNNGKKFTVENLNRIIKLLLSYYPNEVIQCINTFKYRHKIELSNDYFEKHIEYSIENKKDYDIVIFFIMEMIKRENIKESLIYKSLEYLSESYKTKKIDDALNYHFKKDCERNINNEERFLTIMIIDEWNKKKKVLN